MSELFPHLIVAVRLAGAQLTTAPGRVVVAVALAVGQALLQQHAQLAILLLPHVVGGHKHTICDLLSAVGDQHQMRFRAPRQAGADHGVCMPWQRRRSHAVMQK